MNKKIGVIFHIVEDITQDKVNSKKYCLKIKQQCNTHGIRVIQVFSDEWIANRELVKEKINAIMGSSTLTRIFARKTTIQEIPSKDKNKFLDSNHIQGSDKTQINLGAFSDGNLVAVMTFCKPRILMNKKHYNKSGYWELSRFATLSGYHIVGIASKLLSYFKNNYEWEHIYSFADLRWSSEVNNVYITIGFNVDNIPTPEYHYIIDGKRMHRWGFRKDALKEKYPDQFDPNKTEYENMLEMGFGRVWDCGQVKYVINK